MALAGGESLYGLAGFRDFLSAGVFSVAQPDLALCGGLTEALRIAALAEAFNVPVAPHVWGGAVNFNASLHFAADPARPHMAGPALPVLRIRRFENPLRSAFVDCLAVGENGRSPCRRGLVSGSTYAKSELAPLLTARHELKQARQQSYKLRNIEQYETAY